jgi:DNA-binding transcriptional ArsR family regulator
MLRKMAFLLALLVTAPLAVAAPDGGEPAAAATAAAAPAEVPEVADPSPLADAASAAGGALASAGDAAAAAASATGAFLADAAGAVVDGVKAVASAIGTGLVKLFEGIAWAVKGLAGLVASLFRALGALLAALWGLVAAAASALGGLLARGAMAAAAHPKETAIVAGSATGAGGLLWLLKRYGFLLGLPLYTRLAPGEMLDNEQRARVYEHIRAHPGAHPSQLADALGLGWGTVVYHLSRLEEGKLVSCKSYNNRKCYFATGAQIDAQARTAMAAMGSDPARRLVEAVAAAPGITQKDLAARVGISQALASWHVKRLVGAGVLLVVKEGRSNTLRVAAHVPLAAAALVAA